MYYDVRMNCKVCGKDVDGEGNSEICTFCYNSHPELHYNDCPCLNCQRKRATAMGTPEQRSKQMNKEQATALLSEIQSVIGETFRVSGPWEVCSRDRETGERQGTGIFSIGIFTYPEDECIISIQKEEEWIAIKHLAFSVVRNLTRVVQ